MGTGSSRNKAPPGSADVPASGSTASRTFRRRMRFHHRFCCRCSSTCADRSSRYDPQDRFKVPEFSDPDYAVRPASAADLNAP